MKSSLLPANATDPERALERAAARVGDVGVPIADMWNPDKCPLAWLPFLAWAFSVDTWDATWPESVQRKVVKMAIQVHRVKGTLGALEDALAALDLDAVVTQWFEYGGTPYRFRVDVELTTRGLTKNEQTTIGAVIENSKNERSVLDQLNIWLKAQQAVPFLAGTAMVGTTITIHPYAVYEITTDQAAPQYCAAASLVSTITINPAGA